MSTNIAAHRIAENYARVIERIANACGRADRDPSSVRLVAVTKYAQWPWVETLLDLGVRDLGESRPQQLVERASLPECDVRWHLIGHLQRNKVRPILPLVSLIHSVDSLRLLSRIDVIAEELDVVPRVLLEINVSNEASKDGMSPEDLRRQWDEITALSHVCVDGLMTMAPRCDDPNDARPVFRALRELRDELCRRSPGQVSLEQLSMGMSDDFEVAVEEGATVVRIGSSLFEGVADSHQ